MSDEVVNRTLRAMQNVEPSVATRRSAHAQMMDTFDAFDTAGMDGDDARVAKRDNHHGEIALLLADSGREATSSDPRVRAKPWVPLAAAAAVVLVVVLAGGALVAGLFDQSGGQEVVATGHVVGEIESGADPGDGAFVDELLPRRIEGRFTTGVLGGTTSFVLREPLWLVRHEQGLVRLVVDPNDPASASLAIARPGVPTDVVGDQSVVEFLSSGAFGLTFQILPLEVSGVSSTASTGQYNGGASCTVGEPCLVLYDTPMALGLHSEVSSLFIERPMNDGGTVVLMASVSFADYGDFTPFGRPFKSLLDTISFTDTETQGNSG